MYKSIDVQRYRCIDMLCMSVNENVNVNVYVYVCEYIYTICIYTNIDMYSIQSAADKDRKVFLHSEGNPS